MQKLFAPATLIRTYRDPIAVLILLVDLFPVFAVIGLGWGAAALVFLYWLENLIVGGVTVVRMLSAGIYSKTGQAIPAIFLSLFFSVHYGMFCFVHGFFVNFFSNMSSGSVQPPDIHPLDLIQTAMESGAQMGLFITAIIGMQAILYVRDFLIGGEIGRVRLMEEMSAPYTRIVILHIGIFAGAGALMLIGEPMIGILALILLRGLWGVVLTVRRRFRLDAIG